jgi:hypothetical protein
MEGTEMKIPLENPRHEWQDIIKMELKDVGFEDKN